MLTRAAKHVRRTAATSTRSTGGARPDLCERCGAGARRVAAVAVPAPERRHPPARPDQLATRRSASARATSSAPASASPSDGGRSIGSAHDRRRRPSRHADLRPRGHALADQPRLAAPQADRPARASCSTSSAATGRSDQDDPNDDADDDPLSPRVERVDPVRRGPPQRLLVEPIGLPSDAEDATVMASLEAALKTAIQVAFQLEDSELAAEPLPVATDRRPHPRSTRRPRAAPACCAAWSTTRRRSPRSPGRRSRSATSTPTPATTCGGAAARDGATARRPATTACFATPTSPTTASLDRFSRSATCCCAGPRRRSRSRRRRSRERSSCSGCKALAGTELERRWLAFLDDGGHRLPDARPGADRATPATRPDFLYDERLRRRLRRRPAPRLPRTPGPRRRADSS